MELNEVWLICIKKTWTYSAPDWAKNSKIGAYVYFFFTGKDSGLPDEIQDDDPNNDY